MPPITETKLPACRLLTPQPQSQKSAREANPTCTDAVNADLRIIGTAKDHQDPMEFDLTKEKPNCDLYRDEISRRVQSYSHLLNLEAHPDLVEMRTLYFAAIPSLALGDKSEDWAITQFLGYLHSQALGRWIQAAQNDAHAFMREHPELELEARLHLN